MKNLAIQIKKKYDDARNAGRLAKSGAMPLAQSGGIVVLSKEALQNLQTRIAQLEREVDDWKTEASLAYFRASGITEDKLLSPKKLRERESVSVALQDEHDATQRVSGAENLREPYAEIQIKAPRLALLEIFGSYFATQSKRA